MNKNRLLQRFLRYVAIDTTAEPDAEGYPSSAGQMELGRLLAEELLALGVADARQNQHGIVMGTVPACGGGKGDSPHLPERPGGCFAQTGTVPFSEAAAIALCSHLDSSPETSGANIHPQVIEGYAGGDIVLPGDTSRVIRVADNPELDSLRGRTLITSDGTTLLGADDKAGVAIIMETAAWLIEHPEIAHGPVRVCFTCDEEIGHGVDKLDLSEIGAAACYTLDGHGSGEIDVRDVFGRPGRGDGPRREHPSVDRQGAHDERRPRRRRVRGTPASRHALARDDRRSPRLLASLRNQRRRGRGETEGSAPRFRRQRHSIILPIGCDRRPRRPWTTSRPRKLAWPSNGSIATWPTGCCASPAPSPMPRKP